MSKDKRTYAERIAKPGEREKRRIRAREAARKKRESPEYREQAAEYQRKRRAALSPEEREAEYAAIRAYYRTPAGQAAAARHAAKQKAEGRSRAHRCIWKLTDDELRELFAAQGNVCASCKQPGKLVLDTPYEKGGMDVIIIDHCHKTGARRGLIHQRCNAILGYANDDVSLLEGAAAYLRTTAM